MRTAEVKSQRKNRPRVSFPTKAKSRHPNAWGDTITIQHWLGSRVMVKLVGGTRARGGGGGGVHVPHITNQPCPFSYPPLNGPLLDLLQRDRQHRQRLHGPLKLFAGPSHKKGMIQTARIQAQLRASVLRAGKPKLPGTPIFFDGEFHIFNQRRRTNALAALRNGKTAVHTRYCSLSFI